MIIDLQQVKYAYPESPNQPVLNIPTWSVAEGERLFVHGPSGCGKSTLLNLISGLLTPNEGAITVLNQRLDKMSLRQRDRVRSNHIGYIFQQFNLIPYLNAVENIQLANRFCKSRSIKANRRSIEALLEALNLAASDWSKPTQQLSVGQQQRVAIARAVINQPQLLIADEPSSSLDQESRDRFMTLLMQWVSDHKATLLFVSHDQSLTHYFDRVEALSAINQKAMSQNAINP